MTKMKITALAGLTFLAFSPWAQGTQDYRAVFEAAHQYKSNCGSRINSKGAEEVANDVTEGLYDLNAMLNFYFITCDFNRSVRMAEDHKDGKLNWNAFQAAFDKKDNCGNKIEAGQAERIAKDVAARRYPAEKGIAYAVAVCDAERGAELATAEHQGLFAKAAFDRAFNFKSDCGRFLHDKGAERAARGVKAGRFSLETFLWFYQATCEYERAWRLATAATEGRISQEAFGRALKFKGRSCPEEIAPNGAEAVATEVARGTLELQAFLDFFQSTCDFERSLRLARNSRARGPTPYNELQRTNDAR